MTFRLDDPVPSPNMLTRAQWAARLNSEWHELKAATVEGFFRLGRSLLAAKAEIRARYGHGTWLEFVENDLDFHRRVASAFMRIAVWGDRIGRIGGNASNSIIGLLPPDYTTIAKLTSLADETFDRLVEDGTICPSLQRNEVSKVLRLERVNADEQRVLNLAPIEGKFRTLVFDPAWEYDWLSIAGRAKPGYAMQTLDQLRALDLKQWVDERTGCHLYCWATNNFMAEACKLVGRWGFQHRTVLTWIKPPPFGLGSYFRNSTEHVIFATFGETTTRHSAASIPTHFEAPRGEHSEKPEEFYKIVRAASYPPYGEGNQRQPRQDFTSLFEERANAAAAE
jgi:N6-adenosine-specific RNA methylase IME4